MSIRRLVLFSLVAVLAAPSSALAQADDLLAPLTPSKSATKKPAKPKVVKKKKAEKATAKKPPKAARPAATAKGSKKKNLPPPDDSLLAPLAPVKTELAVVIAGGVRGARLTLDGRDAGALSATPMTVPVAPGDHLLVVRKAGYEDYSRRFTVKEGSTQDVKVALVATMGFARAISDVAGTKVLVDDVEVGTVPLSDILLKPGSREIEFRAEGFRPDIQRINVLAGTNYELVGKMRPLVDTAVASNTPREDVPANPVLDPSSTSQGDDYNPALAFNEKSPDAELEGSSKPWYGRWYVWAGVGAVVAAGTVGAVMATKEPGIKPPNLGTACNNGPCDIVLGGGIRPVRGNGGAQKLAPVGGLRF